MSDYETVLFVARECFVYKVPPRASAAGYKAAEWGDMKAFLWKGRLRILESGTTCSIRLEDKENGDLFALSPYDTSGTSVEPVLDSSRYFVLRIESDKRKAYIGIGFQDRGDSFDFNVALQDWTKRQKAAGTEMEQASPHIPEGPKKDFSLKDGETFSIKLPGGAGRKIVARKSLVGGGGGFLPPPPSKHG